MLPWPWADLQVVLSFASGMALTIGQVEGLFLGNHRDGPILSNVVLLEGDYQSTVLVETESSIYYQPSRIGSITRMPSIRECSVMIQCPVGRLSGT